MKKNILKITAIAVMLAVSAFPVSAVKEPVAAEAAESTSTKQSLKQYYVTSKTLNVRSGPGTNYSVVGSLTRGMVIKVKSVKGEKGNRWAKIKFQGLTAYVSVKHLARK